MEQVDVMAALEAALQETGELTLPGTGVSMGGRFAKADALVIKQMTAQAARWADVIVYRRDNRWIAHRLVLKFPGRSPYVGMTKGDAFLSYDDPFAEKAAVVGCVRGLRFGGHVLSLESWTERLRGQWRAAAGLIGALVWRVAHSVRHLRLARQSGK